MTPLPGFGNPRFPRTFIVTGIAAAIAAPVSRSEILIDLVPDYAGSYCGEEVVTYEVYLRQHHYDPGVQFEDLWLGVVRLDFARSNTELDFSLNPDVDVDGRGPNGLLPDFVFDLAQLPSGGGYYRVTPELPRPTLEYTGAVPDGTHMLILRGDRTPLFLGTVSVALPTESGTYRLDVVSPSDTSGTTGALVRYIYGAFPNQGWWDAAAWSGLRVSDYDNTFLRVGSYPLLASSDPPDGTIDARQDMLSAGGLTRFGFDHVFLDFRMRVRDSLTAGEIEPATFEVLSTATPHPFIRHVDVGSASGGRYVIELEEPLPPGSWTTFVGSIARWDGTVCGPRQPPTTVSIGFLPGDVDGSGRTTAQDITALIDSLNNVPGRVRSRYSTDINHSFASNAHDIIRLIDLMNGVNTSRRWFGVSLPPRPE
ncbi:MAG: hypothetical protein HY763_14930 [Planctomycetes bacterium]|nr:hypothetical protein [Planctomycetota bacterium]